MTNFSFLSFPCSLRGNKFKASLTLACTFCCDGSHWRWIKYLCCIDVVKKDFNLWLNWIPLLLHCLTDTDCDIEVSARHKEPQTRAVRQVSAKCPQDIRSPQPGSLVFNYHSTGIITVKAVKKTKTKKMTSPTSEVSKSISNLSRSLERGVTYKY